MDHLNDPIQHRKIAAIFFLQNYNIAITLQNVAAMLQCCNFAKKILLQFFCAVWVSILFCYSLLPLTSTLFLII